jgi:hypothetical protein
MTIATVVLLALILIGAFSSLAVSIISVRKSRRREESRWHSSGENQDSMVMLRQEVDNAISRSRMAHHSQPVEYISRED